ncbi:hypothetical protein ACFPAF_13395 [Hymenobacter endophyticus]|uniref:Uncharacterized protein n=1 Tax=Hymenobacter endophyticus TaxID=3076335 RepID=A0ABU3TJ84_9BACT|nr:hypothetical protein [Hymenobacter endophyticus]MDU0371397.1 hypothetical protein [Hymenobacter endophyticus]
MATTPTPDHMRVPANLSAENLHQALTELDTKIKTLHNRANATTAGSQATYHQHAEALEVKRARLAEALYHTSSANPPTATPPATTQEAGGTLDEIWRGIETLRQDLRNLI